MKKFFSAVLSVVILLLCGSVWATDTVTVVKRMHSDSLWSRGIQEITWTYSSDDGTIAATGAVTGVTGIIIGAKHEPGGTNTPDAAADYTVVDAASSGMDVLIGAGANIGASRTIISPVESVNSGFVTVVNETLYLAVASLGAGTNDGVFKLYIWLP